MSISSIGRENYFWHKLHSLTGIIPIGYYLIQHLTLNSFSLGGPAHFNGVIAFFDSMPIHFLYALKATGIWIPLIFHAVYGLFITSRSMPNVTEKALRYRENWMYTLQRISGIVAFIFLAYHMTTTSVFAQIYGSELIKYNAWQTQLTSNGYLLLYVYLIGVLASCYHFSYGIWNFCIRWGITISERSQLSMYKFSTACFFLLTGLGWAALAGFLIHKPEIPSEIEVRYAQPLEIKSSSTKNPEDPHLRQHTLHPKSKRISEA